MHEETLDPLQADAAPPGPDSRSRRRVDSGGYDVIGNVRGSVDRLLKMLRRLGYEPTADLTWHHPGGRTAVFTGGIATAHGNTTSCTPLVRSMVDAGTALCVLGAGEFDAIAAAHAPRRVLVPANAPTAAATATTHDDRTEMGDEGFIDWLRTLPLWLDLPDLRVVHACWSDFDIDSLRDVLGNNCLADDDAVVAASTPGSAASVAIRILLHGHQLALPDHAHWCSADGTVHRTAAFRWWSTGPLTLRDRAIVPAGITDRNGEPHCGFDDTPITEAVPMLFGGSPVIVADEPVLAAASPPTPQVLFLEAHTGHPAQLVAYRSNGEQLLTVDHLVVVP